MMDSLSLFVPFGIRFNLEIKESDIVDEGKSKELPETEKRIESRESQGNVIDDGFYLIKPFEPDAIEKVFLKLNEQYGNLISRRALSVIGDAYYYYLFSVIVLGDNLVKVIVLDRSETDSNIKMFPVSDDAIQKFSLNPNVNAVIFYTNLDDNEIAFYVNYNIMTSLSGGYVGSYNFTAYSLGEMFSSYETDKLFLLIEKTVYEHIKRSINGYVNTLLSSLKDYEESLNISTVAEGKQNLEELGRDRNIKMFYEKVFGSYVSVLDEKNKNLHSPEAVISFASFVLNDYKNMIEKNRNVSREEASEGEMVTEFDYEYDDNRESPRKSLSYLLHGMQFLYELSRYNGYSVLSELMNAGRVRLHDLVNTGIDKEQYYSVFVYVIYHVYKNSKDVNDFKLNLLYYLSIFYILLFQHTKMGIDVVEKDIQFEINKSKEIYDWYDEDYVKDTYFKNLVNLKTVYNSMKNYKEKMSKYECFEQLSKLDEGRKMVVDMINNYEFYNKVVNLLMDPRLVFAHRTKNEDLLLYFNKAFQELLDSYKYTEKMPADYEKLLENMIYSHPASSSVLNLSGNSNKCEIYYYMYLLYYSYYVKNSGKLDS
ncbi:MAG: hypothetical protein QXN68_03695 [Thermoplasmata archaeon]